MSQWQIYRGTGEPHSGIVRLPKPPPWRTFDAIMNAPAAAGKNGWTDADWARGKSYRPEDSMLSPVNAALYLRRPLLVTGDPGVGKSTLAYSVAYELGLGTVLRWPITSSSSLKDGLYSYDAIGRLQDVNLHRSSPGVDTRIGRYLRLGPLGTALLPTDTPRVLLIDEIDKASIDLPNDLLSTFEEGEYEISELVRIADTTPDVEVSTADGTARKPIKNGVVRCRQFPFVIMTSNGEREFPPAFLRRCLSCRIDRPGEDQLAKIVEAQLGAEARTAASNLIRDFHRKAQEPNLLATDQLLNVIHLTAHNDLEPRERAELIDLLQHSLSAERS